MAKKLMSVVGATTLLYQQIVQKGVVGLIRYSQEDGSSRLQTHFDWDRPEYEDLVKNAKNIKKHPTEE